ncbi:MAG: Yip1 family protein [Pseudomonadota bacterium]
MTFTLDGLLKMAWRTVTNPREGAEEVLALGIPRQALWPALLLVVVLSMILSVLTNAVLEASGDPAREDIFANPLALGVIEVGFLVLIAAAIYVIGRNMGGRGSFEEGLLLVIWLQFILVCASALQLGALMISGFIAVLISFASVVLFLWLLTHFVAVVHGFRSLAQVFVMILVSMIGISFVLVMVLAILGIDVPMPSEGA